MGCMGEEEEKEERAVERKEEDRAAGARRAPEAAAVVNTRTKQLPCCSVWRGWEVDSQSLLAVAVLDPPAMT